VRYPGTYRYFNADSLADVDQQSLRYREFELFNSDWTAATQTEHQHLQGARSDTLTACWFSTGRASECP